MRIGFRTAGSRHIDGKCVFGTLFMRQFDLYEYTGEYACSGEVAVYLMLQCAPFPFECNCVRYCWIGSPHLNTMLNMFNTHSLTIHNDCVMRFLVSACYLARFVFTHIHIGLSLSTYEMYMKSSHLNVQELHFLANKLETCSTNSLWWGTKISHTRVSYERGFSILTGHKWWLYNTVVVCFPQNSCYKV